MLQSLGVLYHFALATPTVLPNLDTGICTPPAADLLLASQSWGVCLLIPKLLLMLMKSLPGCSEDIPPRATSESHSTHPHVSSPPDPLLHLSSSHFQDGTQVTVHTQESDEDSSVLVQLHKMLLPPPSPSPLVRPSLPPSLLTHYLVSQTHFYPGQLHLLYSLPRIFHPSPCLSPPPLTTRPTPFPFLKGSLFFREGLPNFCAP